MFFFARLPTFPEDLQLGTLPQAVWQWVMLLLRTGTKSIQGLNLF